MTQYRYGVRYVQKASKATNKAAKAKNFAAILYYVVSALHPNRYEYPKSKSKMSSFPSDLLACINRGLLNVEDVMEHFNEVGFDEKSVRTFATEACAGLQQMRNRKNLARKELAEKSTALDVTNDRVASLTASTNKFRGLVSCL